ncbi:MAG TPA: CPBP family intramembrane glutamic endopeptidase [Polyangiaceae bacterium]|nr:CPBP family intramembrane glutamic endopeptidase [Polyangiaceae bacterium]
MKGPLAALRDVLETARAAVVAILHARHAIIMLSAILLILLWGSHGNLELLRFVLPGWLGQGSTAAEGRAVLIPGVPWDQEWISFFAGAFLLVLVPCAIVRFGFGERLRDYGLGGPRRGQGSFTVASTVVLALFAYPSMAVAARSPGMRALYPLFRSFTSYGQFALYELGYFAFFLAIEFMFRGYLLLGLYGAQQAGGATQARESNDPPLLNHYSILVSMLSYTAWHLGKPLPELWSTPIWGIVAGAIVLRSGTLWPVVLVHWSMNVLLDFLIVRDLLH